MTEVIALASRNGDLELKSQCAQSLRALKALVGTINGANGLASLGVQLDSRMIRRALTQVALDLPRAPLRRWLQRSKDAELDRMIGGAAPAPRAQRPLP